MKKAEREAITMLFSAVSAAVPQLSRIVSKTILVKIYEAELKWGLSGFKSRRPKAKAARRKPR